MLNAIELYQTRALFVARQHQSKACASNLVYLEIIFICLQEFLKYS